MLKIIHYILYTNFYEKEILFRFNFSTKLAFGTEMMKQRDKGI